MSLLWNLKTGRKKVATTGFVREGTTFVLAWDYKDIRLFGCRKTSVLNKWKGDGVWEIGTVFRFSLNITIEVGCIGDNGSFQVSKIISHRVGHGGRPGVVESHSKTKGTVGVFPNPHWVD